MIYSSTDYELYQRYITNESLSDVVDSVVPGASFENNQYLTFESHTYISIL